MKYSYIICLLLLFFSGEIWGNNVRIEGDVKVNPEDVVYETRIATLRFRIKWDNSWRDEFNYDAVYLFLKYKVDGEKEEWHHVYLMDEGCVSKSAGYEVLMSKSGTGANMNEGMFLYRKGIGYGPSIVDVELKWKIDVNPDRPLDPSLFTEGKVFVSAMGIEMVYMPRGAFRIGDTKSEKTFFNKCLTVPEKYDILSDTNSNCKYTSYCISSATALANSSNPPSFAVNHINDIKQDGSNAWVGCMEMTGDGDIKDYWMVEFNQPKKIKNIAIESVTGRYATQWEFQGKKSGGEWKGLGAGSEYGDEWAVNSDRVYPATKAITVRDTSNSYTQFRIAIKETYNNSMPIIKTVAMTEVDLYSFTDNSVLVYEPVTRMSGRRGLYSEDTDTWEGTTESYYPNGYPAFFTMKYEISQEQYVAFLNKLNAAQQRARTLGTDLVRLREGEYVFGGKSSPTARNGIKLASIGVNDEPYVFANDLYADDDEYAQDGDGQTIACNFLNAGDMLAYADWTGLRPLTEMEYEKMCRRPFPAPSLWNEYPWNSDQNFVAAPAIASGSDGTPAEKPTEGNINAKNFIGGPLRCGAFAAAGKNQLLSGGSFWGVMELGGNVSEVYYNANTAGRQFHGNLDSYHGNGKISTEGKADLANNIWPVDQNAFCLRGGSFASAERYTRISDRTYHWGIYSNLSAVSEYRDSTVGFRLGRTAPVLTVESELVLENGLTTASATAYDSICSGAEYTIRGNIPAEIKGAYHIAWFISGDGGKTWDLMENAEEPVLEVSGLQNINTTEDRFLEYWFKRYIYSSAADAVVSNPAKLRVINRTISIDRLTDTVDYYDHSLGVTVKTQQSAEIKWYVHRPLAEDIELIPQYTVIPNKEYRNYFKYSDFVDGDGDQKVIIRINMLNHCRYIDTIRVFVEKKPTQTNNVLALDGSPTNPAFKCGDLLCDNEPEGGSELYRTVEIGGRCWMADNLRRIHTVGNSVFYDKITNPDAEFAKKYGRLYNWTAAMKGGTNGTQGICPKGWHVATDPEWRALFAAVGSDVKHLKTQLNDWGYDAVHGANTSRFSAFPAGGYFWRYSDSYPYNTTSGIVCRVGYYDCGPTTTTTRAVTRGWWWTSTQTQSLWQLYNTNDGRVAISIPNVIRMENSAGLIVNDIVAWGSYPGTWGTTGYLSNSIFVGNYNGTNRSDNCLFITSSWANNTDAYNKMRTNFYMPVRCVKDEAPVTE